MAATNNEDGYDFQTKSETATSYECPICKKIIRQFTELPCEHFSCQTCIEQWEGRQLRNHEQQQLEE